MNNNVANSANQISYKLLSFLDIALGVTTMKIGVIHINPFKHMLESIATYNMSNNMLKIT
jgi:hypothetical protein